LNEQTLQLASVISEICNETVLVLISEISFFKKKFKFEPEVTEMVRILYTPGFAKIIFNADP